jgi:hypothetical protein
MRKIAICFSGHLRDFLFRPPNKEKNQLDMFELGIQKMRSNGDQVDIFFSLWEKYNVQTARYSSDLDSNIVTERVLAPLSPTFVEIENFEENLPSFRIDNFCPEMTGEGEVAFNRHQRYLYSTPMFYKIYRANLLKKQHEERHGFVYDAVVRYRANIGLENPLDVGPIDANVLYANSNSKCETGRSLPGEKCRLFGHTHESQMLQDIFFYADSPTMDKVCELYNNLASIFKNHGSTGPERIFYDWVHYDCKLEIGLNPNGFSYINSVPVK